MYSHFLLLAAWPGLDCRPTNYSRREPIKQAGCYLDKRRTVAKQEKERGSSQSELLAVRRTLSVENEDYHTPNVTFH